MLVPHRRENAELGDRRLAADERENALVLLGAEPVRGNKRRSNLRALGLARFWLARWPRVTCACRTFRRCSSHRGTRGTASCRLLEVIGKPGEQAASVGRTERRFHVVFRVRHQAEHVAVVVEHAGNGIGCAVDVPSGIERTVGRGIAKQHPALALEARNGLLIGHVVSLAMGGWHAAYLSGAVAAGEWRVTALGAQIDVAAEEF